MKALPTLFPAVLLLWLSLSGCLSGPAGEHERLNKPPVLPGEEGPAVSSNATNALSGTWRIDKEVDGWAWFVAPARPTDGQQDLRWEATFTSDVELAEDDLILLLNPATLHASPGSYVPSWLQTSFAWGPDDRPMERWMSTSVDVGPDRPTWIVTFLYTTVPGHLLLDIEWSPQDTWRSWQPSWSGEEPLDVEVVQVPNGDTIERTVQVAGSLAAIIPLEEQGTDDRWRHLKLSGNETYDYSAKGNRTGDENSIPPGWGYFTRPPSSAIFSASYEGDEAFERVAFAHHPVDVRPRLDELGFGDGNVGVLRPDDTSFMRFWYGTARP